MVLIRKFSTSISKWKKIVPSNLKGKSVSSQQWLTRQLSDPYVEQAKIMNYRCRSAFKLTEIDDKYKILRPGQTVIDCGAAPGSWTQVAVKRCNADANLIGRPEGLVVGIDKLPIFPIEGAHLLGNVDFTNKETQTSILNIINERRINVILSDIAPNATGVRDIDHENIIKLCYAVLRFAVEVSAEGAALLMKVWDGREVPKLHKTIEKFYKNVKVIKPNASRSDSTEKFLLGQQFKGLKQS